MGASHSKDDDERHQNKELEKGKDHPDNKKLEADKEFKVQWMVGYKSQRVNDTHAPKFLPSQPA